VPSTHSLLRNQGTATPVDMDEVRVILVGEPRSAASDDQAHRPHRISLRACDARDVQIFMQFIDLYFDNG
jgi:hypothetical protein